MNQDSCIFGPTFWSLTLVIVPFSMLLMQRNKLYWSATTKLIKRKFIYKTMTHRWWDLSLANQASARRRRPRRPGFPNSMFPCWDSCFVFWKFAQQPGRPWTGMIASKIQDGKDVEVLRTPDINHLIRWYEPITGKLTQKKWVFQKSVWLMAKKSSKISNEFKFNEIDV